MEPGKLQVHRHTAWETTTIDTTGLEVDVKCARAWSFSTEVADLRVRLLATGCARLTAAALNDAESAAEEQAKTKQVGIWEVPETTGATTTTPPAGTEDEGGAPGWLAGVGRWFSANWVDFFGIVLAVLGLSWVAKAIDNRRLRKHVDVVLTGLPGAGKSDLWLAWRDEAAPDSNSRPTTSLRTSSNLDPMPMGGYTLTPRVIDSAGSDPASVLNFMKAARRRQKRVLVFVLAPSPKNTPTSPAFDHDYVSAQFGYSHFIRALIGAGDRKLRPKLVVVFLTKFDLLSKTSPDDSASAAAKGEVLTKFTETTSAIRGACKNSGIPFQLVVGSSKSKNWGVDLLQKKVARIVLTGKE